MTIMCFENVTVVKNTSENTSCLKGSQAKLSLNLFLGYKKMRYSIPTGLFSHCLMNEFPSFSMTFKNNGNKRTL